MPEPTVTGFVPTWFRSTPFDPADAVPVAYGTVPDQDPRVVTRLVPKDHGTSLPARTVSRVIDLKQNLAYYAARDVVEGTNPNFADLTSLAHIRKFATLAIEPAEPGSYVIPARLPAVNANAPASFDSDAVVARYAEMLAAIDDPTKAERVSIGALQVCRELGSLLRRDVETIEVTTYDRENEARPTYRMLPASVDKIDRILDDRRVTHRELETLIGKLEAIDIGKNVFQLKIKDDRRRVRGTAAFFHLGSLRDRLGETVAFEGEVVRERKSVTMTAYRVVESEFE